LLFLVAALPVAGQGPAVNHAASRLGPPLPQPKSLLGDLLNLPILLPGGIGADLTVSFEDVTGLSPTHLGVTSQLVSPLNLGLLLRLPGLTAILSSFPVLLRIEPPAAGGLTFTGITEIQLHTHNLLYFPGTPLRLFAAPLGGTFTDITDDMGPGSYRVSGSRGGFSEFLIVADLTPVHQVIVAKYNRLSQILVDNAAAIPAPLYADLTSELASSRAHYLAGNTAAAIDDLDLFLTAVEEHSGSDIPDVWRSTHDVVNVAGLLRAAGRTLRFSLNLDL
ncbi:MAG TPA: DUF6689 family protein, partial [Thermoanaerobaculia bacterium]|nr:DUF6689 family protein [Thermoanaerobaculia bacterium]